jgi:DNA-binding MarR family transcriptional regulator
MTNTLNKLEVAGYIHVRPDWDDARRKLVALSPAGKRARETALAAVSPVVSSFVGELGREKLRGVLPVLRDLRLRLESDV